MDIHDRGTFIHSISQIARRYPSSRWGTSSVEAYWIALQFFALEDLLIAMERAAKESPRFMPSAGVIREHASQIERKRRAEIKQTVQEKPCTNPAPDDQQYAQTYIEAAKDPWERLARKWEVESKQLGLGRGGPTPKEIGKKRFAEFWDLWTEQKEKRG